MPKIIWNDDFYVRVYELAKSGLTETKMAEVLGISVNTFRMWKEKKPAFRKALKRARKSRKAAEQITFREYVYDRLPDDLKSLWDEINACEEEENGIKRVEALLAEAGKRARQHLFLYALTSSSFNTSAACRKVNISRQTFERWVTSDPEFKALIDEIHWHKGNFFESALIDLVSRRNVLATIFVNKTFNRSRGYNEKMEVEHSGSVNAGFSVDDLELPIETRRQLLDAMRKKEESAKPELQEVAE